jgi:hypothetical protein
MNVNDPKDRVRVDGTGAGRAPDTARAAIRDLTSEVRRLIDRCIEVESGLQAGVPASDEISAERWWQCQVARLKQALLVLHAYLAWASIRGFCEPVEEKSDPLQPLYDALRILAEHLERQKYAVLKTEPATDVADWRPPQYEAMECAQSAIEATMAYLRYCRPALVHPGDPDDEWLTWP